MLTYQQSKANKPISSALIRIRVNQGFLSSTKNISIVSVRVLLVESYFSVRDFDNN